MYQRWIATVFIAAMAALAVAVAAPSSTGVSTAFAAKAPATAKPVPKNPNRPKAAAAAAAQSAAASSPPPSPSSSAPQVFTPLPGGLVRPNIVFVLTDDLAMNLLPYMPNVQMMQREGTTFSAYFVTDSLCCPSRSSIFTGKLPHDTGVFTNTPPDGGYATFNQKGNEADTFAVALQGAGYKTAMLGKYLNGYEPKANQPPKGWDEWDVAGNGYREFNYDLNQNGKVVHYGSEP